MRVRFETTDGMCWIDPEQVSDLVKVGDHQTRINTSLTSFTVIGTLAEVLEKLQGPKPLRFLEEDLIRLAHSEPSPLEVP